MGISTFRNVNAEKLQIIPLYWHIIPPGGSGISGYKPLWKYASSDITSGRVKLDKSG